MLTRQAIAVRFIMRILRNSNVAWQGTGRA
jgi:hypothetical protein